MRARSLLQLPFDVAPTCIDITYAAHTASCTFLLDSEGICRRIVMAPKGKRREGSRTAAKCVGAQYVASLDGSAAGGLVEMPRVGASMLFARVDERGRVSLVRTGVVTSFESMAAEDPFVEPAKSIDSGTVETSAPDLLASLTPHERRDVPVPAVPDPDYYEESDRTQRIQALRPEDVAAALEQSNALDTAEYRAVTDDDDDYRPTLVPIPARPQRAAAVAGAPMPRTYAPPARSSDIQVSRRRRGG